jgi:hypothetical protein
LRGDIDHIVSACSPTIHIVNQSSNLFGVGLELDEYLHISLITAVLQADLTA